MFHSTPSLATALATTILLLPSAVHARFGEEQVPVAAIQALDGSFGQSGQASTLAGSVPGVLLAAANPCAKLTLADQIITTLSPSAASPPAAVLSAAAGLVGAEQNFNPFVVNIPSICADASLPATQQLRGIVPLVDPAVTGSDVENQNAKASLQTRFAVTAGMSVADVMKANGFSNFTSVDGNGNAIADNGGSSSGSAPAASSSSAPAVATTLIRSCIPFTPSSSPTPSPSPSPSAAPANTGDSSRSFSHPAVGSRATSDPVTGTFAGFSLSSNPSLNFGKCVPTVKFEESLNGRAAGEFTFQAIDPLVNAGQQEALNPDIIFNRICDQLVNVCGADDATVTFCNTAEAELGGGAKDASTGRKWNARMGFAGTGLNPDGAPKNGLVGHT